MNQMNHPRRLSAAMLAAPLVAKGLVPTDHKIYASSTAATVRAVAEFEPMGGVLLAYAGTVAPPITHRQLPPSSPRSFGVPDELIIRMQQDGTVHIFVLCNDGPEFQAMVATLSSSARSLSLPFDAALVHQVPWDSDTVWTRDFGPWWVQTNGDQSLGIAKHVYTSLGSGAVGLVEGSEDKDPTTQGGIFRPNDSSAADSFSDFLDAPVRAWNRDGHTPSLTPHHWYFTGLLDVGGNYLVTGDGIIASSYLVAAQNELPGDDTIDARMSYIMAQANRFLGAAKYLVLTDPSGTYIGHIDCWGKFLDRRTVLIAHSQEPAIDEAYNNIASVFADMGFAIHRVMCPAIDVSIAASTNTTATTDSTTAAYCNSLILNDCVYVPIAGRGHEADDQAALDVYRAALPSHRIFGIEGKPEFPWLGTDALHCRTRGVPKAVVDNWVVAAG